VTESVNDYFSFLSPRGSPGRMTGRLSAKGVGSLISTTSSCVPLKRPQPMPSPLSFKSEKHSKLESDLPTHVRSFRTHGAARSFGRVRQVVILATCVAVALTFGGFICAHSGHYSRDITRNPAHLIRAKSGAVASENIQCSEIGVDIMKDGGNAIDAAIATTFCIGVVNMFS